MVVALALSGLGMGVSMPATSSTMSNEVAESEYGVMSAASLLAAQVGEVAGIQVVLTMQESLARHAGLGNVHHSTELLHSFSVAVLGRPGRGRAGRGLRARSSGRWPAVRRGARSWRPTPA